jgi:thiamine-monophosphate kinase
MLSRNRAATACVDLSDGLGDGVRRIGEASGVGAVIDAGTLPIEQGAARWFAEQDKDPVLAAITGGDDYELLFTARPRLRGRLSAARRHGQATITKIGVITAERSLVLRRASGVEEPLPGGYTHFR